MEAPQHTSDTPRPLRQAPEAQGAAWGARAVQGHTRLWGKPIPRTKSHPQCRRRRQRRRGGARAGLQAQAQAQAQSHAQSQAPAQAQAQAQAQAHAQAQAEAETQWQWQWGSTGGQHEPGDRRRVWRPHPTEPRLWDPRGQG